MKRYVGAATIRQGRIEHEEPSEFAAYKQIVKEGERLRVIVEPYPEHRTDRAVNLFHALRDRYAAQCGIDRVKAKIDFKLAHGPRLPIQHNFSCDRPGQVVELPNGEFMFLVSLNAYTLEEMHTLIQGTIRECIDAQVDIEDLIQEYRT